MSAWKTLLPLSLPNYRNICTLPDFYEVIIERHKRASTIVTSNRTIEEWIPLFDDPILAQSALDRLAHNGYQVIIDGPRYRSRQHRGQTPSPHPARQTG